MWPVHSQGNVRRTSSNWLRKEPPVSCVASPHQGNVSQTGFNWLRKEPPVSCVASPQPSYRKPNQFPLAKEGATCLPYVQSTTKVSNQNQFQLPQEGATCLLCGQSTTKVPKPANPVPTDSARNHLSPVWPVHSQGNGSRTSSNWLRKEPPVSCVASPQPVPTG